jgi:DNA-binding IclR family transcriptional regulator
MKKYRDLTHKEILDYLKRQKGPITINQAARVFGMNRSSILVMIDTMTFRNPKIAEDEKGRVYLIKDEGAKP